MEILTHETSLCDLFLENEPAASVSFDNCPFKSNFTWKLRLAGSLCGPATSGLFLQLLDHQPAQLCLQLTVNIRKMQFFAKFSLGRRDFISFFPEIIAARAVWNKQNNNFNEREERYLDLVPVLLLSACMSADT